MNVSGIIPAETSVHEASTAQDTSTSNTDTPSKTPSQPRLSASGGASTLPAIINISNNNSNNNNKLAAVAAGTSEQLIPVTTTASGLDDVRRGVETPIFGTAPTSPNTTTSAHSESASVVDSVVTSVLSDEPIRPTSINLPILAGMTANQRKRYRKTGLLPKSSDDAQ